MRLAVPLLSALFLAGCYELDPLATTPDAPAAEETLIDGPAVLSGLDADTADALFDDVAAAAAVPADLLRALAWVESGFASLQGDRVGWLGLDGDAVDAAAARTGLTPAFIASNRAAGLLAGATRLADLRGSVAPGADPQELDAAWWPVVTAWADTGVPWLDDAFAVDVFTATQRGVIAPTEDTESEFVVITPRLVPGLAEVVPELPPAAPSQYFGGLWVGGDAVDRTGGIGRIVVTTAEAGWVRAVLDSDAHYVVRPSDGRVAQRVRHERTAGADDTLTIAIAGGAASPGTFTVQALEGAGRLAGWLAREEGLDVGSLDLDLGPHFPAAPWTEMVRCFSAEEPGCDAGLAGGVLAAEWPVSTDADAEARSEGRDSVSVPYFYQYANSLHPSASCQNTSIAMVLKWAGWSGTPDDITARFGKNLAQSPAGLAQVFNTLASDAGLEARLTARTNGSLPGLNSLLAEGKPVIVHGYMTGYGHVVVATGRAGSDYVVNDPAGRWSEQFKGGYPYGWNGSVGRSIRYARAPFEAAISTSNGSSYLPLWYHELSGVDGTPATEEPPAEEPPAEEPPAEEPPAEDPGSDTGAPGSSSTQYYDWADVAWLRPLDGDSVSNPVTLEARRWNGGTIEFLAGSWALGDSTANPAVVLKEFSQLGARSLTARNLSVWGTVLAESTIQVDVGSQQASECAVIGTISCGQTVTGDNGSAAASDAIDGYPNVVGNWSGPEMAWTWSGGGGEVTIRLVDPRPSEINHDILILEQSAGVCVAPDQVAVAWNAVTFEPTPGAAYTFVVDSHQDVGPFSLALECGD